MGLLFGSTDTFGVYSNADYAGDKDSSKSTSGVVSVNGGAVVTWQTKKQQCVAQSTTEAEYVSAAAAAKETYG